MPPDLPRDGSGGDGQAGTPDERWLEAWLTMARRRWRLWIGLRSVAAGIGAVLLARAFLAGSSVAFPLAIAAGVITSTIVFAADRGVRGWRPVVLAAEAEAPATRNALLTWREMRGELSPVIAARLATQSRRALEGVPSPRPRSIAGWSLPIVLLAAAALASIVAGRPARDGAPPPEPTPMRTPTGTAALDWAALATPPAYAHKAVQRVHRPSRLQVLAGTRIQFEFHHWPEGARARLGQNDAAAMTSTAALRSIQVTPTASDVLQVFGRAQQVLASITIVVVPDAPPAVRITAPAADLRRDAATGTVSIRITAHDDLGLNDLRLRFTKVSGSGESFTFEDGEWPVQVSRTSEREWAGAHQVDLAAVGLSPGDSLVYHAVAHDARVGAEGAAESDRFLIEITRPGALSAGDFSLPEPEEKFALSQRMVIQLTERLLEQRPRMTAEAFGEEAQSLAMAQRRVRAEFVFMLGGEVQDEVEEAAHAHEVEEGREANRGKGDLTEAVRQMSQAETRLTARDVREALPYEYRALAALQSAFGKARYFMRTLPAAVQIDASRRLQGDRAKAASVRWTATPLPDAVRTAGLALLGRLESSGASVDALLPELVALDRGNAGWVALVQEAAADEGSAGVSRALRARLLPDSPRWMPMPLARSAGEAAITTPATGARR